MSVISRHSYRRRRMDYFEIGRIIFLLLSLETLLSSGSRVSNNSINYIGASHIYDLDELDDIITTYMRERKIPGASVAISKCGQFLMRKGYGRASAQRLMTPWALMRVGSVSKIITAVSILRLQDEGRLELDSKVFGPEGILSEYIVDRDSRSERRALLNITVRQLLQHTAGWDHRQVGDPLFQKDLSTALPNPSISTAPLSKEAIVRFMLNHTLQYTPGTRYSYSNFGYMLLGLVVERVAGVSYESYTRDLLRLLGIYRMKIGGTLKEETDVSEVEYFSRYPHDRVQSVLNATQLVSPPYGGFNMAVIDSSCGWISSASDLVRLVESLADPSSISRSSVALLSNSTVQQMLTRPSYTSASVWYGLGLVVEEGGQAYWHSGTLDGSTSIVSHDEHGFTWAALLNCKLDPNDLGDFLRYAIRRVFLDGPLTAGARDPPPPHENSLNSVMHNRQSRVVDSTSSDGRNIVKLMIPDYKLAEVLATVSSRLYRLSWIDAYEELGYVFFNAIWTQNDGTRWRAYFDLTSSRYRKRFKARVAQGYRLSHVETYVSKRRLRYAAIFVKDEWPEWTAYDSYSPQRHKTEFFRLLNDGYRLVVQSVTEYKGQVYVAAVYDKIYLGEIRVRLGLTLDEFTEELERQLASGRILSYVQSYENRGQLRFSAVWSPRTTRYWAVSQAMTKYMLMNKLHEYAVVNVPLSCVTAYHNDEVLYFAALWR